MAATVTLSNLLGSQVEFIPGSSPEFVQSLTDFAGPETVSTLLPIAPYLVIAKNNGTATIRAITMIWRWYSQDADQIGELNSMFAMKPGCFPGQGALMAPVSGLTALLVKQESYGAGSALQSHSNLNKTVDSFLQKVERVSEISIELDSVIFRDHTYIGPDHSGMIETEKNERRIRNQVATGLLNQASCDRTAYLQSIIDAWNKDQPESVTIEVFERASTAMSMMGLVRRSGSGSDEALFRRSMENIIRNETQESTLRQER